MRRVLSAPIVAVLACLLASMGGSLSSGAARADSATQVPGMVPKPGAQGGIEAPALSGALLRSKGVDPKRIEAALNNLAAPQPDLAASLVGSHSSQLYRALAPLVVLVVTDDGLGSGSIISADGYVLTNNHVILGYDQVGVILKPVIEGDSPSDADAFAADVVKVDEVADLALLKIRNWTPWSFVELGDADAISVGDDVHAIGHPKGETWTYTKGVISAMRRGYAWTYENEFKHQADLIQTQTPINPGNSGGPLFDDGGRLIGVNSFGESGYQGLNFAVSVREVRRFLDTPENRYAESSAPQAAASCEPAVLFTGRNQSDDAEIRMTDNDCDDYPEMIEVWFDDQSLGYAVEFDDDQDGRWETAVVDSDLDGRWDYSLYDTNSDGVVDLRGLHPDGAWKASGFEQV